jgi:hypothetical protein
MVIAGGGAGGGNGSYDSNGSIGLGRYGGGGGGGGSAGTNSQEFIYGGGGGPERGPYGGGGRGSYIDSSAITTITEISGVASPDDSLNGEIIITAVPEPATLALARLSGLALLLFRPRREK